MPLPNARFASRAAVLAAALALALPAGAATVLADGFDAENGGVGSAEYSGFANFTAANIDLLAPPYFFELCQSAGGSTPCLDLEGSGNGSLTTKLAYAVGAGQTVGLQFDLAGDQRGFSGNGVTVSLVSTLGALLFSESFSLPSAAPFTTFMRSVTLPSAADVRLSFLSTGPADARGLLLDNVRLDIGAAAQAVPEPASAPLAVAGLAGLALGARRRRG